MWNISEKAVEKIKTHILGSIFFFFFFFFAESRTVYEIMLKNLLRAREATDNNPNKAHALCMPDN